jgi:hypothetical protein
VHNLPDFVLNHSQHVISGSRVRPAMVPWRRWREWAAGAADDGVVHRLSSQPAGRRPAHAGSQPRLRKVSLLRWPTN